MRQDIKALASKIDSAMALCKKVLECGEKIRGLSPIDMDMNAYAETLTQFTEDRGRATYAAIQEISSINSSYAEIEKDSTASASEKGYLSEKIRTVQDLSPLFAKQNAVLKRIIETHLTVLRKESAQFHSNVGVIKSYLKTPDKRTFYG